MRLTDTTSSENVEETLERIAQRIIQLCDDPLRHGRPYLVSRLGLDLGKDVHDLRRLTDKRLVEFIQSYEPLKARYNVVPVGDRKNVFAIVPAIETAPLMEAGVVSFEPSAEPRYHYRFWAAFAVPSDGRRRFFNLTQLIFKGFSETEDVPSEWIPIEDEFIAPAKAENRDELITRNIASWLKEHGVEKTRVLHRARPVQLPQKSLLLSVIEALDKRQLQSTSMTLDVVATLLEKKH